MIIDFHAHAFPDKIADKAIRNLAAAANIPPFRDGTSASLQSSMRESGVGCSVILQVATNPGQVAGINRFSFAQNGKEQLYYSGAIHPDSENIEDILDGIKNAGLFGIKLHPDYQGVYLTDQRYLRIMEAAAKRGLITVTHAGVDLAYPDDVHCTPAMVDEVLRRLGGIIDNKLVLAHMGGVDFPDAFLEKLEGKPVYIDTSFVLDRYPEKCAEIIRRHGADRVLFGSDTPWAGQKAYVERLNAFRLTEEEKDMIFFRNAQKLLKLP